MYLNWKDPNDYTGYETYIALIIKDNDTSWFPFGRAWELKEVRDS
jgi:hypothetical protein